MRAAISQSHLQREFNGLILERVAVFPEGLEDLHGKRGSDGRQKSSWRCPEEGNPGAHPGRGGFYFVEQLQLESACRTTNQLASFRARSQKPNKEFRKWLRT
jgi:hypothetical protein